MRRRTFLNTAALAPSWLAAQQGPPREERIEKLTAGPAPAIALNHLGFLPQARKLLVVRATGDAAPADFQLRDIGQPSLPFRLTLPLRRATGDFGDCLVGDFTAVDREAMYQVTAGGERSVPFFIRGDVWRRTLPTAAGYIHAQRCGTDVPNVHPVCHLDDARRRDTGERLDTTGGWHDAGDLRKWMSATIMNGFGLLAVARQLGEGWDPGGAGLAALLEEMRWGNRYFLKMQDRDGRVFNDVGGGVNGDNSDNHWTDNRIGTADDRYVNPSKPGPVQAMFTSLEAMCAQAFRTRDADYAKTCLGAALRCWEAAPHGSSAAETAWWARAALELHRATGREEFASAAAAGARALLELQNTEFTGAQKLVRGFWRASASGPAPYTEAVHSALPPLVLLELAAALPQHADAARAFGERAYRDLALRQLEWVMGANPFGACLMTGAGMRHPYPHSRFVGLIPGGILNGIAGNTRDEPVLDTEYGYDWRTTEYWSPHNGYYLCAVSSLEVGRS